MPIPRPSQHFHVQGGVEARLMLPWTGSRTPLRRRPRRKESSYPKAQGLALGWAPGFGASPEKWRLSFCFPKPGAACH